MTEVVRRMGKLKFVAVCASPVKGGNVEALTAEAFNDKEIEDKVEARFFRLSELDVGACRHCNWCLKNQEDSRLCAVRDGMDQIHPHLLKCDGLLVATPVHFLRLSGHAANFLDRLRIYSHGNLTAGAMRNKVGGAVAVSWFRNAGIEQAINTVCSAYHVLKMIVAAPDAGLIGGGAFSSLDGTGEIIRGERHAVLKDEFGIASAKSVVRRMVELCEIMRRAKEDYQS